VVGAGRLCAAIVLTPDAAPLEIESMLVHDAFGAALPLATRVLSEASVSADGSLDRAWALAALRGVMHAEHVPPTTAAERAVADIFKAVLGLAELSIVDSFFDLGGTSLLSVRLFAEIERTLGVRLPLATLLRVSNVADLAKLVDAARASELLTHDTHTADSSFSPLVPIQQGDGVSPLFCVHGAGGNVLNLRDIARHLGVQQGFYGLQAQGVDGSAPLRSVAEMASLYLEAVRSIQPSGPYYLAGYSGGGVVAYEMAQRLRKAGEHVALLVLFDTFEAGIRPQSTSLRAHLERLRVDGARYPWTWAQSKISRQLGHALRQLKVRMYGMQSKPVPLALRDHQLCETIRQATQQYQPEPYLGPVVLYRASHVDPPFRHAGPKHGWDALTPELSVVEVPGNHDSLVREPNVGVIAAHLNASLAALARQPPAEIRLV
jgi:thioesterase domain-containing protein/acyl carrier protein